MDYCNVAQSEGRCKSQELSGLYRMIEINQKYENGEFDMLFKDNKIYVQDFDTKVEIELDGDIK